MSQPFAQPTDLPEISVISEPACGMRSEVSTPRYSISVEDRGDQGGDSILPNSLELLLAGLASSLEATCRRQAERLGVPLSYAMVKVSATILPETEQPASLNCRIDVESGISNSVLERLAALVRMHCTILGMLDGNTKIDIEFRPLAI